MDKVGTASHEYNLNIWLNRIRECRTSGKTVAIWCFENGVGLKSYYYWLRKIRLEAYERLPAVHKRKPAIATNESETIFTQVSLNVVETETQVSNAAVVIHLNGATIEIQNAASENTITNTLRAISKLC